MTPRRGVAWAALGLFILLLVAYEVSVRPEHASRIDHMREGSDLPSHFKTHGLVLGRHDPATDTTVVVPMCGHSHCDTAIRVEGELGPERFGSSILKGPAQVQVEALEPPLESDDGNVTEVLAGTFTLRPISHDVLYVSVLVAGAGAAGLVLLGRSLMAAAVGCGLMFGSAWLGAHLGSLIDAGFQAFGTGVLLAWFLVAAGWGIRGRWHTAAGQVALGTFVAAVVGLWILWESFAHPPFF